MVDKFDNLKHSFSGKGPIIDTKLHPGQSYVTTSVYYLSFICLGMATAVLGPTLQGLAKNTASTLAQISSLFLLSSFGYLFGSIIAGRLFDRIKGHPILSIALLVVASMMGLAPLIGTLLFLQIIFFIIGIAEGNLDVGVNTLIVWLHGDRVPPFMNGLHAFYGVGTTIAPLIVAVVLSAVGTLNNIYSALAILIVPVGLLILFFPSPSHSQAKLLTEDRPVVPVLVILTAVIFFAFTGAELGFGGWIYTYTTFKEYADPSMAASINAAFWAAITVGRLVSIPISVKIKPKKILWVNFCGIILSLLIIMFFSSSETLLWIGTIGTGLFMASTFPTLLNDAQNRMNISGKVTSIFFIGSSLGSMALPWLMGQLIAPFGANAAILAVFCSILLSMATFYILNFKQRTLLASSPLYSSPGKSEE
jgi:MFS transporter, FHS family, Na+ dependent glucose transporter 1